MIKLDQSQKPLVDSLKEHISNSPHSYHVPGHKNGQLFPDEFADWRPFLAYDVTELPGLDDLHEPSGAIAQAQQLAAHYYGVDETYFLVNGTTAGNLAMIMATCEAGDHVLVQRNSHKSIMHALHLVGARPIFVTPDFDQATGRFSSLRAEVMAEAISSYPSIKAVVLTYPDYFGATYDLKSIVKEAHARQIPVLIDEAHGAHFKVSDAFPKSAVDCGADVVVQSAHKTLPALTMGSFLHLQSAYVSANLLKYYLQVFQSSSPSYLIMMSLDLARYTVANLHKEDVKKTLDWIEKFNKMIDQLDGFQVSAVRKGVDDPLKTIITSDRYNLHDVLMWLHENGIDAELVSEQQLLLIHGLNLDDESWEERIRTMTDCLKGIPFKPNHDRIETNISFQSGIVRLPYSYKDLRQFSQVFINFQEAIGRIAAESITPYPPGIPVIVEGEIITSEAVEMIEQAKAESVHIQTAGSSSHTQIKVYSIE
ncbi:lysine decarboxylase [Alkalibacillus almallahensis]|nr:lysine decarboxylase [Alkalibacillus almallahensis]